MKKPHLHPHEADRLEALQNYGILDTEPEEEFDDVVEYIQQELNVPISLISLVDASRQWFKAAKGLSATETHRDISFCGHAILDDELFEIQDASKDPRFFDNPLVMDKPNIRFYAGVQIVTESGLPLGTLCVIDSKPRELTLPQKRMMKLLAKQVMRLIESRFQREKIEEYVQVIHQERNMLEAISFLQNAYISGEDSYSIFSRFLSELLTLTSSEYGFIGEVLSNDEGVHFLKTRAITDISWNDQTSIWYKENAPAGLEFSNLDTLFGQVIKTGKTLIANDAPNHPLSSGIPKGHPPLKRFLGIPFKQSGELIGMIGLANRIEEYDQELVKALSTVLSTCTTLIVAQREQEQKERSDLKLKTEIIKNEKLAEQFNSIYQFSRDGIVELDPTSGKITDCNQALADILGHESSEILGKTIDNILTPKGDIDLVVRRFNESGERFASYTIESSLIHKQEHLIPVEIDMFCSQDKGENETSAWALVRDLRELKEKEQRRVQEQKMNSLGTLSGGVAHDFNNILSIILSNAEFASMINDNDSVSKRLDAIEKASLRGAEITSKILNFAKVRDVTKEPVNIKTTVQEAIRLVDALVPSTISLSIALDDVGYTLASQDDVSQIVMNLVSNSIDAISPSNGTIEIVLRKSNDKSQAVLVFKDSGSGIKPELLDRIFDPFFTTKHQKNGTGLGLATVFSIIKDIGGNIDVKSLVPKGTQFKICLPLKQTEDVTNEGMRMELSDVDRQLHILVAEDEEFLLEIYKERLEARGHDVVGCLSGNMALDVLGKTKEKFDVLLTDDAMPGMRGSELIQKIWSQCGPIKSFLVTGNVTDEAKGLEEKGVIKKIFQKPISFDKLIQEIES